MNGWIFALVMVGGALGAGLRHAIGHWMIRHASDGLPWGTLAANLLGSLLAGFLAAWLQGRGLLGEGMRALLIVGVMGGLTTWSALMLEMLAFGRSQQLEKALVYFGVSLVAGLLLVWMGYRLGEALRGPM